MSQIPWLPGAFGGLDRRSPATATWMNSLLHLSNFSFFGGYLNRRWDNPNASWPKDLSELLVQNWGIMNVSIPRSLNSWDGFQKMRPADARSMGEEHARLIKKYSKDLVHDLQGSIVYVDNEDWLPDKGIFPEAVLQYYNGIFTELRRLGPENLALRPGFYVRTPVFWNVIKSEIENADLFLYNCDEDQDFTNRETEVPFDQRGGRIYTPVQKHPIRGLLYDEYGSINPDPDQREQRTVLPIARQWRFYNQKKGDPKRYPMPKGKMTGLQEQLDWCFDVCMVRDPRFPIALPRIAATEEVILRTTFKVLAYQPKANPLATTQLEEVYASLPSALPFAHNNDQMLEHEAPLVLLPRAPKETLQQFPPGGNNLAQPPGLDPELITLNKNALFVSISSRWNGWEKPVPISVADMPSLRRNRGIAATKTFGSESIDTQIFFVSSIHKLMGTRRLTFDRWTTPALVDSSERISHPFSELVAAVRYSQKDPSLNATDIFFLDGESRLCVATCAASDKSWPSSSTVTRIEDPQLVPEPILLRGTSMAAVSPSYTDTLFFAIGVDCNLHMSFRDVSSKTGWTKLGRVEGGGLKLPKFPGADKEDQDDRLFPHAKMDAFASSASKVYVASLTAVNVPCVYVFNKSGTKWELERRRYYHNRPDVQEPIDPTATFKVAPGLPTDYNPKILQPRTTSGKSVDLSRGYAFNPYGDIKLSMAGPNLTIWLAGVTMTATDGYAGDRVVLMFTEVLVDDEKIIWKRIK